LPGTPPGRVAPFVLHSTLAIRVIGEFFSIAAAHSIDLLLF
jgi:hypothetical protein